MSLEVLHQDGKLAKRAAQLALQCLSLEDEGTDGEELIVATHALVVPANIEGKQQSVSSW